MKDGLRGWGEQAAGLFISVACRNATNDVGRNVVLIVAGKLPVTSSLAACAPPKKSEEDCMVIGRARPFAARSRARQLCEF